MSTRNVTLSVDLPEADTARVALAYEVLSRAAAALVLEGMESSIYSYVREEDQ